MAFRVLTVDFTIDMTTEEYGRLAEGVASAIAGVPGLVRKTWIWNAETREAGGLYLFEDQASLEAYWNGPIIAKLRQSPRVTHLRARQFDVLEQATVTTRGVNSSFAAA